MGVALVGTESSMVDDALSVGESGKIPTAESGIIQLIDDGTADFFTGLIVQHEDITLIA